MLIVNVVSVHAQHHARAVYTIYIQFLYTVLYYELILTHLHVHIIQTCICMCRYVSGAAGGE